MNPSGALSIANLFNSWKPSHKSKLFLSIGILNDFLLRILFHEWRQQAILLSNFRAKVALNRVAQLFQRWEVCLLAFEKLICDRETSEKVANPKRFCS
jgi:hypothetical protein